MGWVGWECEGCVGGRPFVEGMVRGAVVAVSLGGGGGGWGLGCEACLRQFKW